MRPLETVKACRPSLNLHSLAILPTILFVLASQSVRAAALNQTDRALVARALAEGQSSGRFVIACESAATERVVRELRSNGAQVEKFISPVGYVRARIPINRISAVERDANIERIDFFAESTFDYYLAGEKAEPAPTGSTEPSDLPTPSHLTPAVNPFTGLGMMGVPQFLSRHPRYDGRGVIIGLLEPVDPLAPGLQQARNLRGQIVPKIASFHAAEGPFDREAGGGYHNMFLGWVDMRRVVNAIGGRFSWRGIKYRAPSDGRFRLGFFTPGSPYLHFKSSDVEIDHSPSMSFPVLWDDARDLVWVDVNQDGDFSNEQSVHSYRGPQDIGTIPAKFLGFGYGQHPAGGAMTTDTKYIVDTDHADHFIRLDYYIGLTQHANMVAGSAAGSGFFEGAFNGVAPGAQIAVLDPGYPFLLEDMYLLAKSRVDVISNSLGLRSYRTGDGVMDLVVDRIIRLTNVPIVFAAGNAGPAAQGVEMPSTASEGISVGAYISAETALYDEGVRLSDQTGMLALYSARGPAQDGALKPDIVAQTEWLTSGTPEDAPITFRQKFQLPRGYVVGNGTSQAAPSAAGALALLISAAKQSRLFYTAQTLKLALTTSAHPLPDGHFEVGNGLVDVPAAWTALQGLARHPPPRIDAVAPVHTATSSQFADPGVGRGLYEREGWHAAMFGTRTISYRLSPNAQLGVATYIVRIIGDVTFRAPGTITLRSNRWVPLKIAIGPLTNGIHSAIVELIDKRSNTVIDERLCTVVASERFSAEKSYTIEKAGSVNESGVRRFFFDVPKGATALSVAVTVPRREAASFDRYADEQFTVIARPDGTIEPITARRVPASDGGHWSQAFESPEPGVWEIDLRKLGLRRTAGSRTQSPQIYPIHFRLRAAVYNVVARAIGRLRRSVQIQMINRWAPIHLASAEARLARTKLIRLHLSTDQDHAVIPFNLPPGNAEVYARFTGRIRDPMNLYLFNCTNGITAQNPAYADQGGCLLAASSLASSGGTIATTADPPGILSALYDPRILPSGRWVLVIDADRVAYRKSTAIEIGFVEGSTLSSRSQGDCVLSPGKRWVETFVLPSWSTVPNRTAIFLSLHAANALTIWRKAYVSSPGSRRGINHSFGTVWSRVLPLTPAASH